MCEEVGDFSVSVCEEEDFSESLYVGRRETHWAGLIGDMTGEGTPTHHHHHCHCRYRVDNIVVEIIIIVKLIMIAII